MALSQLAAERTQVAVTDKVDALCDQPKQLPADTLGAKLHREHHRPLGSGYCTRPRELDCAFEPICETCAFFQTSIEFRPTLQAQHDDATAKNQTGREQLSANLLDWPAAVISDGGPS